MASNLTNERRLLLPRNTGRLNRPARPTRPGGPRTSSSVPSSRGLAGDEALGVSPGGRSWHRRISENARTQGRISDSDSPLPVGDIGRRRRNEESESEGDGQTRRPYHYYGSQSSLTGQPMAGQLTGADPVEVAHYRRYQYYNRLQNQTGVNLSVLNIPSHVLPVQFYQIHFLGVSPSAGKQSSLVTIFAIWNTMMGTSLLSMPWALEQAGLVMGLIMMALMAGLCLYTAYRILQVYTVHSRTMKISEFGDLCGLLLGKWAEYIATLFSVLAILGAAIVYWVLMSNFLFSTVSFVHDHVVGSNSTHEDGVYCPKNETPQSFDINISISNSSSSEFETIWGQFTTVPLFLIILVFPMINLKSATFFTKFNALGTVSIIFILTSVLFRCYEWGINADFSDPTSDQFIPLIKSSFPSLTGILALGLFIHNAIITIMSNNKHQEHNGRDMSIAYILVTGTYMLIGAAFYISFPLPKTCIEDNLLNNFHPTDVITVAAKIFLFFQMMTVFPLIMYLLRVSVLYMMFKQIWPGLLHIVLLNASIISVCVLFAIYMPNIGTIIRFSGAACGLTIIFALPIMVYLASVKRTGDLTWNSIILHSFIIMLGALNFIAQFFI